MSELNNLIPVSYDNPERPTVSGRELHDFLKIETPYAKWFGRMTEYGFTEGEDYAEVLDKNVQNPLGGRPSTDHQLTIPMAKELCMIQRNERGKQARQYFLAIEAQWNSPEAVMRRAVLIAQKQNDQLKAVNKQLLAENSERKDISMSEKIIAYKGMDENMTCRGKQYEVGKTYYEDKADCCHAGMHACENPLDVLHYYPLKDSPRFFEVECGGNVDKSGEDSKLACTELTVKGEVNFAGLVKATVNAVFNRVKGKEPFSSGYSSTAGSSGYYSTAGSSGRYSTAGSSGDYSTAGSSGDSSTAGSSGYYSTAGSSGDYSTAGSSGDYSTAGSSGDSSTAGSSGYSSTAGSSGYSSTAGSSGRYSTAGSSGYYSTAGSSGDSSTAGSSGYYSTAGSSGRSSTAGSSGDSSTAGSSGDYSTAAATGVYCSAKACGKDSIAVVNGAYGKACGALGCYLVLTEYDDDGNMLWAKMAKVDGAHIKENVWYTLKNGEFVEAEP